MSHKKYYIIGVPCTLYGLFAIYKNIVTHIIYAVENGYIPIVDLQHYSNQYFKDGRIYKDNVWEYFFEQPFGIGLNDIEDNAEIIINENIPHSDSKYLVRARNLPGKDRAKNKLITPYVKDYIKYLKFNKETKEYLETESNKIIGNETEILGILCRGTDYVQLQPNKHPIQPEPKAVIKKTKKLLRRYKYKKIWLATEDANIFKMFKKKFGDILLDNPQYMYSDVNNDYLCHIKDNRKDHFYNLAREYLLSVYILSKCKSFIGGRTNGTLAVYFLSDCFRNFQKLFLWNIGLYSSECKNETIDKKFSLINILKKIFTENK